MKKLFFSFLTLCMLNSYQTSATEPESKKTEIEQEDYRPIIKCIHCEKALAIMKCPDCGKILGSAPLPPTKATKEDTLSDLEMDYWLKYKYRPYLDHYNQHRDEKVERDRKIVAEIISSTPYRADGSLDTERLTWAQFNYYANVGAWTKSYQDEIQRALLARRSRR